MSVPHRKCSVHRCQPRITLDEDRSCICGDAVQKLADRITQQICIDLMLGIFIRCKVFREFFQRRGKFTGAALFRIPCRKQIKRDVADRCRKICKQLFRFCRRYGVLDLEPHIVDCFFCILTPMQDLQCDLEASVFILFFCRSDCTFVACGK